MYVPYIKVKQKGEIFFITKFNAFDLKKLVYFHVRDPYKAEYDDNDKFNGFIKKLDGEGLKFGDSDISIQRRLQVSKIREIKDYINENNSNFIPNAVILAADVTQSNNFEENYLEYEEKDYGQFNFDENTKFMIIDGQHRLAGIFLADEETVKEMEIPAIVLFNVSLSTAAKLFTDINGKQKPVNKSLVYDLYQEINYNDSNLIKKLNSICKSFYENKKSPLFRQIKMLGIGNGAISQSFFIDYVSSALKEAHIDNREPQYIYNQLFYYFKAFQNVFPEDWPVPTEFHSLNDVEGYSRYVLKERKSQLVKTNGFGAILKLFPYVYAISNENYEEYFNVIKKLSNKLKWTSDDSNPMGTGKQFQKHIFEEMKRILEVDSGSIVQEDKLYLDEI